MNWEMSMKLVICQIAEKIEQLRIQDADDEVKSIIGVLNNNKQCSFFLAQFFQIHFIVGH